ncbi:hypothetical protein GIB67_039118, partial [Kingdonia uniflora]
CEGRCMRSFHALIGTGADSHCNTLGFSRAQLEVVKKFLCLNCKYKIHTCYACGKLGSSNKSSGAELKLVAFIGKIAFQDSENEDITTRAWNACAFVFGLFGASVALTPPPAARDHEIDEEIGTPIRNHIKFPFDKRPQLSNLQSIKSKMRKLVADDFAGERNVAKTSKSFGSMSVEAKSAGSNLRRRETHAFGRRVRPLEKSRLTDASRKSFKEGIIKSVLGKIPRPSMVDDSRSEPSLDAKDKNRIIALMESKSSSITKEDVTRNHIFPSTHANSSKHSIDKITMGMVEGYVRVNTMFHLLLQNKLSSYLAPFLHGKRYTSYGRHFTNVDKLKEVVDFCCGANDWNQIMKDKLLETGKKCSFKNFDIIRPKNDFNFEEKDWMKVKIGELPAGSELIIGLNPPYGVKAYLANKFIDKALEFKPKLVILIVPPETKRLDRKRVPYGLVWEDNQQFKGKSFYLPGSVDMKGNAMEQWNTTAPHLYLWSRPDVTAYHKAIALKQGHTCQEAKHSNNKEIEKEAKWLDFSEEIRMDISSDCGTYDDISKLFTNCGEISNRNTLFEENNQEERATVAPNYGCTKYQSPTKPNTESDEGNHMRCISDTRPDARRNGADSSPFRPAGLGHSSDAHENSSANEENNQEERVTVAPNYGCTKYKSPTKPSTESDEGNHMRGISDTQPDGKRNGADNSPFRPTGPGHPTDAHETSSANQTTLSEENNQEGRVRITLNFGCTKFQLCTNPSTKSDEENHLRGISDTRPDARNNSNGVDSSPFRPTDPDHLSDAHESSSVRVEIDEISNQNTLSEENNLEEPVKITPKYGCTKYQPRTNPNTKSDEGNHLRGISDTRSDARSNSADNSPFRPTDPRHPSDAHKTSSVRAEMEENIRNFRAIQPSTVENLDDIEMSYNYRTFWSSEHNHRWTPNINEVDEKYSGVMDTPQLVQIYGGPDYCSFQGRSYLSTLDTGFGIMPSQACIQYGLPGLVAESSHNSANSLVMNHNVPGFDEFNDENTHSFGAEMSLVGRSGVYCFPDPLYPPGPELLYPPGTEPVYPSGIESVYPFGTEPLYPPGTEPLYGWWRLDKEKPFNEEVKEISEVKWLECWMSYVRFLRLELEAPRISSERKREMGEEIKSLAKVWVTVLASLCYVYFIVSKISKGKLRLLSLLPVIALFTLLPMSLLTVHLCGLTALLVTWLANFRLLLFAFDQGPLSLERPIPGQSFISLLRFLSVACLPIKIKAQQTTKKGLKSPTNYAIKALLLAIVIHTYGYKKHLHRDVVLALNCCLTYFSAEIILAMCAAPAQAVLGLEIEPQFDEPYLSTSLQDFWGKRWNLIVPSILRPTVYYPIRTRILGKRWALTVAVVSTFVVSGLMHELFYYYLTRVMPTWEVTMFFVLHGFCLALEIIVKKAVGDRWRLHPVISRALTIGFVSISSFWFFFPQMTRHGVDEKVVQEYGILYRYVKDNVLRSVRG